jgi:hypothetical protein
MVQGFLVVCRWAGEAAAAVGVLVLLGSVGQGVLQDGLGMDTTVASVVMRCDYVDTHQEKGLATHTPK